MPSSPERAAKQRDWVEYPEGVVLSNGGWNDAAKDEMARAAANELYCWVAGALAVAVVVVGVTIIVNRRQAWTRRTR
jgi:hypothetical protein